MKPVLALAALLVAALIGLAVWMGRGGSEPSEPAVDPAQRERRIAGLEHEQARERELAEPSGSATTPAAPERVREYRVGDVMVRDRRKDGGPPVTEEPSFVPPEGIHLTREYASRVTTLMQPAAKKCLQALPADSSGDKTKVDVTMTVAVKNGSLTVSDVAAKSPALEESVMAQTLGCLRQQMVGSTLDAAGQPDIPSYSITTYYTP